ncbi:uncharacterized protein A1O9_09326 [Exophiala aquamarina CBS 119918]|uniref:Cas1p 10 TM acyl transferase domain-containing protein n=1 Tax=Exophiala aquamarina CBS 119918 TaxID=1182545 RepID=A0A072P6I0_9EURO|nr:uncharacterized protein A1O9_09326 [Exophiala aquamarina CBS 119918]KEF54883.1 hypothetical protein A1O9_09326 [Exophiala aquamarina CBS 119918]
MLYPYKSDDVQQCLSKRSLIFLGDSTARDLFWAISYKLDLSRALDIHSKSGKHQNVIFSSEQAEVKFIWDPFLNATSAVDQHVFPDSPNGGEVSKLFVVGAGLWHIKHLGPRHQSVSRHFLQTRPDSRLGPFNAILLPISVSQSKRLAINPSGPFDSERAGHWNILSTEISSSKNASMDFGIFRSYLEMIDGAINAFEQDGIHISHTITPVIADVLLNSICNPSGHIPEDQYTAYCCVSSNRPNVAQKLFLLLGLTFVICHLLRHLKHRRCRHCSSDGSPDRDRRPCVAESVTSIMIALNYCFVADRSVIFEKSSKLVDPTSFSVLSIFTLLLGLIPSTSVASPTRTITDITSSHLRYPQSLSRSQTEEWKGWMQIVILLYHYFGMSKVLWAYQLARVLVASYLFMTGYGHTMYFLRTGDFSSRRIAIVLFRTNILSIALAFMMGTQFDLYYFPMLSSLWFLIIYITMVPFSKSRLTTHELIFRIVLSALTIRVLVESSSTLESLFKTVANLRIGLMIIDGKEFMFRFQLDAYVVYVGMLAGTYCSRDSANDDISTVIPSRTSVDFVKRRRWLRRPVVPGALCLVVAYICFCGSFEDKYDYNRWHPITSPFVVVAFAIIRNSTERLSRSWSRLFAWLGRCSLETFVLQYHIWLASNSHGLLRFRRFDVLLRSAGINVIWTDIIEFTILSALFLYISSNVSSALPILTAKFINEQRGPIRAFKSKIDTTKPPCNTIDSKTLFVDFRTKLALVALLLWGLNICWLYLE